jgi:hypothetical protein
VKISKLKTLMPGLSDRKNLIACFHSIPGLLAGCDHAEKNVVDFCPLFIPSSKFGSYLQTVVFNRLQGDQMNL